MLLIGGACVSRTLFICFVLRCLETMDEWIVFMFVWIVSCVVLSACVSMFVVYWVLWKIVCFLVRGGFGCCLRWCSGCDG